MPVHTYLDTGIYSVTLIAQDVNGCGNDTLVQEVHISSLVSIDQSLNQFLLIYPNPAHDQLIFSSKELNTSEINIQIYDSRGKWIYR